MPQLLIANRGYGENKPDEPVHVQENTVNAVLMAGYHNYTMVAINVQLTKDDVVVLWHDDAIFYSTTGGYIAEIPICEMTYEDLLELMQLPDLKLYRPIDDNEMEVWIDNKQHEISINTLEEVISACPNMRMAIELRVPALKKNDNHYRKKLADQVTNICNVSPDHFVCISFDVLISSMVKRNKHKAMLITSSDKEMSLANSIELANALELDGVVAYTNMITSDNTVKGLWSYGAYANPFVSTCIVDAKL
jgi:glycerophosphoryl diester phosphodiesterase